MMNWLRMDWCAWCKNHGASVFLWKYQKGEWILWTTT